MKQRYIVEESKDFDFEVVDSTIDSTEARLIAVCYTQKNAELVAESLNKVCKMIQDEQNAYEMGG